MGHTVLRRFERLAYRFCVDSSCDVVCFDASGRSFMTRKVRVPVWGNNRRPNA